MPDQEQESHVVMRIVEQFGDTMGIIAHELMPHGFPGIDAVLKTNNADIGLSITQLSGSAKFFEDRSVAGPKWETIRSEIQKEITDSEISIVVNTDFVKNKDLNCGYTRALIDNIKRMPIIEDPHSFPVAINGVTVAVERLPPFPEMHKSPMTVFVAFAEKSDYQERLLGLVRNKCLSREKWAGAQAMLAIHAVDIQLMNYRTVARLIKNESAAWDRYFSGVFVVDVLTRVEFIPAFSAS
jgi:hypothetical protein